MPPATSSDGQPSKPPSSPSSSPAPDTHAQAVGSAVHDLNNLLTAILGYTDVLAEHLGPDSRVHPIMDHIRSAARRAGALTEELLVLHRSAREKPRPIDLNAFLQQLLPTLYALLRSRPEIDLRVDLHAPPPVALVRSTDLERVVLNLTTNARDAMPGGGRLVLSTSLVEAPAAPASDSQSSIRSSALSVQDDGPGVPDSLRDRVFEPFFTTKDGGTGLGLASARTLVERNGGAIRLHSRPGKGTIFQVLFPAL